MTLYRHNVLVYTLLHFWERHRKQNKGVQIGSTLKKTLISIICI